MIINLIGPPAVGKSTFAAKYVLEHPYFTYCAIDAYRVEYQNEELAWAKLFEDVAQHKEVMVESTGLDWKLKETLPSYRDIFTIAFVGHVDIIRARLVNRQHKRPIPYKYDYRDEIINIAWTLDHLGDSPFPIEFEIDTVEKDTEEVYEEVSKVILEARIRNEHRRKRCQRSRT